MLNAIRSLGLALVCLGATILGCQVSGSSSRSPDLPIAASPQSTLAPWTADPAITDAKTFKTVAVVKGLEHPWGMVWLPDGTMLVTERPGRVRRIHNGKSDPKPIPGVPEVLGVGQGGLLDISLHPQFAQNPWVYFTYAHGSASANQTRVARARFNGKALTNWTVIFQVNREKQREQHFGSRMTWLPDQTLLVSIGDGGNPPIQLGGNLIRNQAQQLDSQLGKIVRLHADGSVPKDNPFVNQAGANPAVWSYGHRNIQGLAYDPGRKQIWASEHGALGGDELNFIEAGQNYGWPLVTYSREYSGGEISAERSRPEFRDPAIVWTTAIAPSGLMIYRGDRVPQWQGRIFAGGLVSKDLRQIEVNPQGRVIQQTSIPIGQRVRDVRQGPDGLIYILTDEAQGQLIRLEPISERR